MTKTSATPKDERPRMEAGQRTEALVREFAKGKQALLYFRDGYVWLREEEY